MIKIRFGNTRMVFIFFNIFVIKIFNPRADWIIKSWKSKNRVFDFIKTLPKLCYEAFIYGTSANISEALIYIQAKQTSFLSPVFSLGLLSLQRYEGENEPTQLEIQSLYEALPERIRNQLREVNGHDKAACNWRKTKRGLILIDYGVSSLDTWWANFLICPGRDFNQATTSF